MAEIEITQELEPAKGASIAEQRRALPDEPGVYIFRNTDGEGPLRRQGNVDSQKGRPATSRARHGPAQ